MPLSSLRNLRRTRTLLVTVIAAVFGAGTTVAGMAAESPLAVVLQASGDVEAERAGQVDRTPGRLDLLYPGDNWRTGDSGQLALRFIDNSLVRLNPGTSVTVDRAGTELQLGLLSGGVEIARFASNAGPALLRVTGEGSSEELLAGPSPIAVSLNASAGVESRPIDDPEQLQAISQLTPDGWSWLSGGESAAASGSRLAPGEQNLVERYRERTPLSVPELMVTEEVARIVRQSSEVPTEPAPPEPPVDPEPELTEEERYQQDLDTTLLQLGALLRGRENAQAFTFAESRRADFEGEPDFDLLYGRAALNEGRYQRSSFALERAMINYPGQPAVRLTLVEAYLGLGNTQAAGRQLERAAQSDLTSRQQVRWERLDEVRRRLELRNQITHNYSLSGQGFFNTNLNQGLSCSVCELTDNFDYEPGDDSRAQSGAGVSVQGRYDRVRPLSQRERRTFAAGLNGRITSLDAANSLGGLFSIGQQWDPGRRISADLLPGWSPSRVSLTAAVNGGLDDVWQSRDLTGTLSATVDDQESQSVQLNVNLADDWAWARSDGALSGRWQVGNLINLGSASEQHYAGISLTLTPAWTPEGRWVYQGVLSYQLQQYLDNETFGGELQRNHQFQLGATALRPLSEATQVSVDTRWQQVISNQTLAEYGALEIALGVQHRW